MCHLRVPSLPKCDVLSDRVYWFLGSNSPCPCWNHVTCLGPALPRLLGPTLIPKRGALHKPLGSATCLCSETQPHPLPWFLRGDPCPRLNAGTSPPLPRPCQSLSKNPDSSCYSSLADILPVCPPDSPNTVGYYSLPHPCCTPQHSSDLMLEPLMLLAAWHHLHHHHHPMPTVTHSP